MALYKDSSHMGQVEDVIFDQLNSPGTPTPRSGIYRCTACGKEVVSEQENPLPPQTHHVHDVPAAIQWKLQVFAQHKGS